MKKRILNILTVILICGMILVYMPITASAESLYIRKIVSVVYDDSGSMVGSKWAYANYAMQAFCGMLNSEDQLYITYMTKAGVYNYEPEKIDLSSSGIQNSVYSIKNHLDTGGTPYSAVTKAFDKLKSVDDSNPNTQYWLVIITDGDFNDDVYTKKDLEKNFKAYAQTEMPNKTKPQVIMLGIGNSVTVPDEDQSNGVYVYKSADASGIIDSMSQMADRISGRTRLKKSDIKKIDGKTISVSSSIPLLNIAAFVQGSGARIDKAEIVGEKRDIPITRKAELGYSGYGEDLSGGAFLLGDSKNVISAGDYTVRFDKEIDLDNVIVLYEPALEVRMSVTLNGKELSDFSELRNSIEGDTVSVSYKIFEMGTNNEISPSLMPSGTKFDLEVFEDGKSVVKDNSEKRKIDSYTLKNVNTSIKASVTIEGFNPIEYSVDFKPDVYVPRVVYTVSAEFVNNIKSVKLDDIAANTDTAIAFTVYADGNALTDPSEVKALNPVISVSPDGNSGTVTYTADGKIVYLPTAAKNPSPASTDSFNVSVKCTLDNGAFASETYTVLISSYEVIAVSTNDSVKKTELFDNKVSASFYIKKDGVRLDKSSVENNISVSLNEEYAGLKTKTDVSDDGMITVTPYSEEHYELNFWKWWGNYIHYWGLESKDITVTLNHPFGSADNTIDVVGAGLKYELLNVWAPFALEFILVAVIAAYLIRYFTKARFDPNGVLYVGSIDLYSGMGGNRTHSLELRKIRLNRYNKFKYLKNPFKELSISASGVKITAAKGNQIICNNRFPWYSSAVVPKDVNFVINSPDDIISYCDDHDYLIIKEIKPETVMNEQDRRITLDNTIFYFVDAEISYSKNNGKQTEVIENATAFCYGQ
ncbi:MAG: hypothetical protein II777_08310 [Clostridia bacterium]|nr:hypothetical protein [Clostridia bacterium]